MKPELRGRTISDFKKGDFQVLLCSVDTAGIGMNLEHCNRSILYGLPWSFGQFSQAVDRVHRITSKDPVRIYTILLKRSIDETRYYLIGQKNRSAAMAWDGSSSDAMIEWDYERVIQEAKERHKGEIKAIHESEIESGIDAMIKGVQSEIPSMFKLMNSDGQYSLFEDF